MSDLNFFEDAALAAKRSTPHVAFSRQHCLNIIDLQQSSPLLGSFSSTQLLLIGL